MVVAGEAVEVAAVQVLAGVAAAVEAVQGR